MFNRRNLERFIRSEPFFFVLTQDRFRIDRWTEDSHDAFFSSAVDYVETILRSAPPAEFLIGLEFGCGPGRVAIPLSRRIKHVVAVDESPAMLEVARREAERAGCDNIEVAHVSALRDDSRRYDLINCSLILQRVPARQARDIIRDLANRLTERGILALQFPHRDRTPMTVGAVRAARRLLPPLNAAINVARGKPRSEPYRPTFTHSIDWVVDQLTEIGLDDVQLLPTSDAELDYAILTARRRPVSRSASPGTDCQRRDRNDAGDAALISVSELLSITSIDELNEKAEAYFSSLKDWQYQLSKPFGGVDDAPAILINVAILLQGLDLVPGQTVLDFGGGTGWLSRILTQLGCRVIVVDVSQTALTIAAELYRRVPVVGDHPPPAFLHYGGQTLDLPDASVDRVVCFDAFHHAPNPDLVLSEFARVLRPGGRAGFAEPGPHHSRTAQSQFEMRTYGVLENDIDIHGIWKTARRAGFTDIRVALFNIPPHTVTLQGFDDFMRGGPSSEAWSDATRRSLQNVRNFFLWRAGDEPVDSRTASSLGCAIEVLSSSTSTGGGEIQLRATNTGTGTWLPASALIGGVAIGCHLYRSGRLEVFDWVRSPLLQPVAVGESVEIALQLPPLDPGTYVARVDCVAEKISWFAMRSYDIVDVQLDYTTTHSG